MWSLLLTTLVLAGEDPEADFRGGLRQVRVGGILAWSGIGMAGTGIGLIAADEGSFSAAFTFGVLMAPPGGITAMVGVPLMNVGALRAARAVENGGGRVTQLPGHLAWVLYAGAGVAVVTGFSDQWWFDERVGAGTAITSSLLLGSLALTQWQASAAVAAGKEMGLTPSVRVPPREKNLPDFWLQVAPAPVGGAPGVVVGGVF